MGHIGVILKVKKCIKHYVDYLDVVLNISFPSHFISSLFLFVPFSLL